VSQGVALASAIGAGMMALTLAARLLQIEEFATLTSGARRRVQKLLAG
jgi:hypothetical protein